MNRAYRVCDPMFSARTEVAPLVFVADVRLA
jgi:hypothetical protein